jgi:hypothetical protein
MNRAIEQKVLDAVWKLIGGELELEKGRIYERIRNYPTPITACDEPFDQLLAERDRISQALGRMREVSQECQTHRAPGELIAAFVRSSPHLSRETQEQIRTLLADARSEPGG